MLRDKFLDKSKIAQKIKESYDITINDFIFIPEGETSYCYKFFDTNNNQYFLKIFSSQNFEEFSNKSKIINEIRDSNNLKTIIPFIKSLKSNFVELLNNEYAFSISKYIPDFHNTYGVKLTDNEISTIASDLSTIHKSYKEYLHLLPKEDFSIYFYDTLIKMIHYSEKQQPSNTKLISIIQANKELIHNRLDELLSLQKGVNLREINWILAHDDLHNGNILKSNENIYISDWDRMKIAPIEQDFMFFTNDIDRFSRFYFKSSDLIKLNSDILKFLKLRRIFEDMYDWMDKVINQSDKFTISEIDAYVNAVISECIEDLKKSFK